MNNVNTVKTGIAGLNCCASNAVQNSLKISQTTSNVLFTCVDHKNSMLIYLSESYLLLGNSLVPRRFFFKENIILNSVLLYRSVENIILNSGLYI